MPGPNANGFVSQWNIGLRSDVIHERGHCYEHWAVYCSRYVIISKESDLDRNCVKLLINDLEDLNITHEQLIVY